MCKRIGALALGALLAVHNTPRLEGGAFATELTQLLNHGQLVMQYIRQGEQLSNEIKMYGDMLRNAKPLAGQVYGPIMADINSLASVVQGGMALAYSMANLDAQFQNPISRIRFIAERLLSGLQGLVSDDTGHNAGSTSRSGAARPATAKRADDPRFAAKYGARLGWEDAGSPGTWANLRTAGSAAHEAPGANAGGPVQQTGVPGHRHSAPGCQ